MEDSVKNIAYPRARIPMLPVLDWGALPGLFRRSVRSMDAQTVALRSGTVAIAMALRHAGIGRGHEVLVPAYHCISMIEPVLAVGASVRLFQVDEDLSVDLNHAYTKLRDASSAILVPHYFGFPQDLKEVTNFCNRHNLVHVEDCAHALFSGLTGLAFQSQGDYSIFSVRKFFPTGEGGFLISNKADLASVTEMPVSWQSDLKTILNILEEAASYGRFWPFHLLIVALAKAVTKMSRLMRSGIHHAAQENAGENTSDSDHLSPENILKRMASPTQRLAMRSNISRFSKRRRENYCLLLESLSDLPGCRPLHMSLPECVVPYVFPFIVDRPEELFLKLKNAGVPIYRWENLQPSDCQVSQKYAASLFQLPCHQSLRPKEIRWMIRVIRAAIKE